ncbi:MAG: hypothetical protein A2Z91_03935 [Deltaproteobacteria bacterium GWA2_38_16]|nr:MAG: hypothetical protein A2Z91_03935 [Deltaproteobacteria bacterium GWA2_38_16]OGQ01858.1 MAG: hypothetical protein A3D19_03055 [Deltaproteobacteria bacterium RIFCSPHIGHO2_02_FULL_38_15]OGQ59373.1 MAG: hypothetical protein A3G92_00855 [Deltaproteobacteria bacterium RIFCSPLOWO2_12_FULL_38_8]HBQ20787.1 hypothetical protein [Deltaproteobacteria bacterium]
MSKAILILTPFFSPNVGGVETHLDDLCKALIKRGIHVFVLTYQPLASSLKAPAKEVSRNLYVRRLWWFGRKKDMFHKLQNKPLLQFLYLTPYLFLYSFYFLIRFPQIETIHAMGATGTFIGRFLALVFRKKFIADIETVYNQSILSRYHNWVLKWILNGANHIFIPAEVMRPQLIHTYGVPSQKISVFRYWIDQAVFYPRKDNHEKLFSQWNNKFIVLFVGRLLEIKGVDLLMEIALQVPQDVLFVVIGEGTRKEYLRQQMAHYPNMVFMGPVLNSELRKYYWSADLFIMPSLYEEGFGRVNMEALACGLPVLASDKKGIREALQEGTGIFVEPTAHNFARAIVDLKNNPQKIQIMKQNANVFTKRFFSEKNIDCFLKVYQS